MKTVSLPPAAFAKMWENATDKDLLHHKAGPVQGRAFDASDCVLRFSWSQNGKTDSHEIHWQSPGNEEKEFTQFLTEINALTIKHCPDTQLNYFPRSR
jgi:hypothetical protein